MIMMYLGIKGKTFSNVGLRDLTVQSDVVATGSVDRALSGKMFVLINLFIKISTDDY